MHYMYLRDQNQFPHSCLAFQVDWKANVVSYGISTVHPSDKNTSYNKAHARDLAVGRMVNQNRKLQLVEKCSSIHDIRWSLMSAISQDKMLPKRVRKSVINWLITSDEAIPAPPPTERKISEDASSSDPLGSSNDFEEELY